MHHTPTFHPTSPHSLAASATRAHGRAGAAGGVGHVVRQGGARGRGAADARAAKVQTAAGRADAVALGEKVSDAGAGDLQAAGLGQGTGHGTGACRRDAAQCMLAERMQTNDPLASSGTPASDRDTETSQGDWVCMFLPLQGRSPGSGRKTHSDPGYPQCDVASPGGSGYAPAGAEPTTKGLGRLSSPRVDSSCSAML